jgi:hypothetical protein
MPDSNGYIDLGKVHFVTRAPRDWIADKAYNKFIQELGGRVIISADDLYEFLRSKRRAGMNAKLGFYLHYFRGATIRRDLSPSDLERRLEKICRAVIQQNLSLSDLEGRLEEIYESEHISACIGTIELRGWQILVAGKEFRVKIFEEWIQACLPGLQRGLGLTPERAAQILEAISAVRGPVQPSAGGGG